MEEGKSEDSNELKDDEGGDQPLNRSVKLQPNAIPNNVQTPQGASRAPAKKPSPVYLFYALAGCVSFSLSGILRKYQGSNVFFANSIMTIAFMVVAIVHFLHQAIKKRAAGEKYLFPWQYKGNTSFGEVIMTDKPLLFKIIFGGFLEFVGAQAQVISYDGAISGGMNGGLCAAIVACNTVFVLILAYFMFGEKITKISFVAILFLIVSAVLVGLFTPDI